jgi:hypothetical protein
MRTVCIALLIPGLLAPMGCATITGTVTGAFTGAVDAPAQVYRHNRETFEDMPMLYGVDFLVVGAFGMATGPIMGFLKGLSIDVQWLVGHVDYGDAFGTYGPTSIWRPFTGDWPTHPGDIRDD